MSEELEALARSHERAARILRDPEQLALLMAPGPADVVLMTGDEFRATLPNPGSPRA